MKKNSNAIEPILQSWKSNEDSIEARGRITDCGKVIGKYQIYTHRYANFGRVPSIHMLEL